MMASRAFHRLFLCAIVALVSSSCGAAVRQGRSSVFLVIDTLQGAAGGGFNANRFGGTLFSDVSVNVTSPAPCSTTSPCATVYSDSGQVVHRLAPKDVSVEPTTNNQVTITRYTVNYRRADGRNTPGVDVPYSFSGAVTGTVPPTGTATLSFELVRYVAKAESPLVQLIANPTVISTLTDVTFYGKDQVGNDISVTGSLQIEFGNFGDQ
jgi:hypothetical protein